MSAQTLGRGLPVLEPIGAAGNGLTTSEIAAQTGLHRSIVHRLLVSLERTGYAARDGSGRYALGPALVALAARARPGLHEVAAPVLHALAAELDATASLVEAIGDAAVTALVAEPPTDGPRFSYRLGNRDPLDRGAGGLAVLASGPAVPGEPARVASVRTDGVVTTHGELNPGAYGIAAPIAGLQGVRAAVTVITSREDVAARAEPLVAAAAAEIANGLGGPTEEG